MGIDSNNAGLIVDADIIRDADKFKMDLIGGLERTLHGQVKPSKLPHYTPLCTVLRCILGQQANLYE
jgi:hypothetical protein